MKPSLRRVRQIDLPVQKVRGLIEDLCPVPCVRDVTGAGLPGGPPNVDLDTQTETG